MRSISKKIYIFAFILSFSSLIALNPPGAVAQYAATDLKVKAAFDFKKTADWSDYDPASPVIPTGDTIKIALVASFSGPGAILGQAYFACVQQVAHEINKRGGIMVDGKKKPVQIIKADIGTSLDQTKTMCERMALQEKVHFFWGVNGSGNAKIMNDTANKYKIIAMNAAALSDELQEGTSFSRYAFMVAMQTSQVGRALAYYYGQVRKKEKKFYILCQDYLFGHSLADGFKEGLKKHYPQAKIVGEDYHKLYLTDYASYLEKVKASGAEVVFTGDFIPDGANLLKQARQAGLKLPFAHIFLNDPNFLTEIGVQGTKGLVQLTHGGFDGVAFKTPDEIKWYKTWNDLWKNKWKTSPYNSIMFETGMGDFEVYRETMYWLMSVIERATSTDPEKIINVWEGDVYKFWNGKVVKMRACDHKIIQDLHVNEYVPPDQQKASFNIPPYYWYDKCSSWGKWYKIPASKVLPRIDPNMDRCKGKNGWGD